VNWFSLAQPIILAWGWRRSLIAFLAGAASTLGLAPINVWPAMFVTFPVLVWLIDGAAASPWRSIRAAFAIGWWFGFGYFLCGLYWIGAAFLVDAKTFGWLMPFAVTLLPAGLALFTGCGVALARALWTPGPLRILTLAAALSAVEWLRGHVLTGFPWNAFGYALTTPLPLAQSVALLGIWGQTFIAIAVFASPATMADERRETRWPALPALFAGLTLIALGTFGAIRLAHNPTELVDKVHLRIMQPNLAQGDKFNYAARHEIMSRYVALSEGVVTGAGASATASAAAPSATGLRDVTHLIWPESAFPFFLAQDGEALAAIADMLPGGTVLITGAASQAEPVPGRTGSRAYNSLYVIDHTGTILQSYDKQHLVPFGEFLPFQDALERLGLMQLTKVQGGFLSGERRRRIALPGAPDFLPLICYEVIFSGETVPKGERPDWLLNVTNDAWFGISSGPYQHFQQAKVTAIAEGLPLVRAANNGISAVVDPLGRVIGALALGQEGLLDAALPRPIPATIYARIGDILFFIVVGVSLFASLMTRIRK
jgi:apolipoprotein N-acyltransferase